MSADICQHPDCLVCCGRARNALIAAALEAAKFMDKDGHCSVFAGALALANLHRAAEQYRKATGGES